MFLEIVQLKSSQPILKIGNKKESRRPPLYGRRLYQQPSSKLTFREGNGTPLQYSCLGNPMDGGALQATVHGVAKSRTRLSNFTFTHWRRKWQPTPVFLPGESQGQRSLVGFCLWGRTESDTTGATQQQQQQQQILSSLSLPLRPRF